MSSENGTPVVKDEKTATNMNGTNGNHHAPTEEDDGNVDSSSFEDVDLNGDEDLKKKKTEQEHPKNENEESPSSSYYSKFLCWQTSNKPVPMSGQDLGVWESSLEDRANIVSSWLLSFMAPLLQLGARKVLNAQDIGVPSKQDRAEPAFLSAQAAWEEQIQKAQAINAKRLLQYEQKLAKCTNEAQRAKMKPPKLVEPSIYAALVKSFGSCAVIVSMLYYVISALLTFVPVLILNDLVKYFQSKGTGSHAYHGYVPPWVEVVALGVTPFLVSILQTRNLTVLNHCAVFVRTAASTLLYRKSLRVSAAGRAKTSTGQVVNMMSNDTQQLQRFLQFAGMILVAPLQIIVALVLVYRQVSKY
jgi:hypothetical protein